MAVLKNIMGHICNFVSQETKEACRVRAAVHSQTCQLQQGQQNSKDIHTVQTRLRRDLGH